MKKLQPNSLVMLRKDACERFLKSLSKDKITPMHNHFISTIAERKAILFLDEISNMPGHGIFVGDDGLIYYGYHLDDFRMARDDEV